MTRCLAFVAIVIGTTAVSETAVAATVDYQREVQPILAEHCWHCHGVDAMDRRGGLRLDQPEAALKGGDSGVPAIVPGNPDESELIRRVLSHDADLQMPPPDQKNPVSAGQIEILRRWVLEGAEYETHWAFQPPVQVSVPDSATGNPIDGFVQKRLRQEQWELSPRAATAAICRRIYLDLIGLPPSPKEISEFEDLGVDATVEKLLNSDRFGEKWARHWLDLARYSDTNGYEKDMQREQWIWRDWVISAINRDMPYNQFLIEQIAGDLLPDARQDQIVATGFLRNSMINEEGAIVPEQFRMVEMFDRMDCIGKAVLGISTQCAQCHSHKFDPITHEEYFGMFAFLNNSYEARSWVYSDEQLQKISEITGKVAAAEDRIRESRPNWQSELLEWARSVEDGLIRWESLQAIELGSISGLNHPQQETDGALLMLGHTSNDVFLVAQPSLQGITGLQLEALPHRDLPHNGPGRSHHGTFQIHEVEVFIQTPDSGSWEKQKLVNATADFSQPENKQADGKKTTGPASLLIDGSDDTSWTPDRGIGRRNQASVAVMQFEKPLNFPNGTRLKVAWRMGEMLGCARLSITTAPDPKAPAMPHGAVLSLGIASDLRSEDDRERIFEAWRRSVPELMEYNNEIDALHGSLPQPRTSVLHLAEREAARTRTTSLLNRGEWDQPLTEVKPHVPAAFHPFPENAPQNRLGFAFWLADERSALTARVAVNQIWQVMFGNGLVETPEDFGTRAPVPEYRELLDWLAVDFMKQGWSRKHLIRTIVSSAVYQQDAAISPDRMTRDPRNQLLARGSRFRVDAEIFRDIALTASGLIAHRSGGPGVIPPVPQNVLDYNYVYPGYWVPATAPDRYSRSVYGFRKRSMPDPVMSGFDAPNGDFACARRVRSNTPLAALTGLNETIFVESARALALRVLRESDRNDADRADYVFLLCTSRLPAPVERAEILDLLSSRRRKLAEGWLNPREITTGDPATMPELPPDTTPQDVAAWTLVARVILNLDETMSR